MMSLWSLYLANTLIHILHSQKVLILKDSETWSDDYAIDNNGIDGWSYGSDVVSTQIIGLDRTYHGWFYDLYTWQYYGYFYRQFQCEYKSTIQVSYSAYFACAYDNMKDGSVLYINENTFESKINGNNIINFTDPIAITLSEQCILDSGRLTAITINTQTIEIDAYLTFDIAFRILVRGSALTIAFGAISDIKITCNKLNINKEFPDPIPNTPTPTILLIQNPEKHIGCSSMDQITCTNHKQLCDWNTKCKCTGGFAVDIMFGIYAELSIDQQEPNAIQKWFIDDVFTNINTQISRIGIISFENEIIINLNINYHTDSEIINAFNNINWDTGWLNYPALFNKVISEFDSIQIRNSQQILVIVSDDNPLIPPSGDYISLCQYKNALQSRGIRVIVILIDHLTNNPKLSNYDCIVQNEFDLIMIPSTLTYLHIHNITNQLSSALCPSIQSLQLTINPSISPTLLPSISPSINPIPTPIPSIFPTLKPSVKPSITPTINPSVFDHSHIEITFEFNITNITIEITDVILSVVAVTGELEKDQINLTIYKNKVTIKAKGDEKQINNIEESVNNGDVEREIEDKTGEKPIVRITNRDNGSISNKQESELKLLIIGLIISISLLICVIIFISVICLYCLFVKKQKNEASTPKTESLKREKYDNINGHHKMMSIQSITGYSMNINEIIQPNDIITLERVENNYKSNNKHIRQITGEYDIELGPATDNIDEDLYLKPNNINNHIKTNSTDSFTTNGECNRNNINTPQQSMNESSDEDDFDEMYIKNESNKKTKGQ